MGSTSNDGNFDSIDNKINFWKTATMLKLLNGRPVSQEALLSALEAMQASVHNKFKQGMSEVTSMTTKAVPQHVLDEANVDIICQDARLSMPGLGRRFLVIRKDAIEVKGRKGETIDSNDLHYLLDLAASTYDIESIEPKGKGTKRLNNDIPASPAFRSGREFIAARI